MPEITKEIPYDIFVKTIVTVEVGIYKAIADDAKIEPEKTIATETANSLLFLAQKLGLDRAQVDAESDKYKIEISELAKLKILLETS